MLGSEKIQVCGYADLWHPARVENESPLTLALSPGVPGARVWEEASCAECEMVFLRTAGRLCHEWTPGSRLGFSVAIGEGDGSDGDWGEDGERVDALLEAAEV